MRYWPLFVLFAWGQVLQIVDEENLPIAGARLYLEGKSLQADSVGQVTLSNGRYLVRIEALGYKPWVGTVEVPGQVTLRRLEYKLEENVITGQAVPVPAMQSLQPVRILSAERIQAQGALYLPHLLATELNVRLQQDPNLGSFLQLQGLSGQNIKVLIDGVPVVGRVGGSVDLGQLPLSEVDRVEIVEGPMSVLYGTDALGGVVNLITRESRCVWEARARLHYESVGVYDGQVSVTGGPARHRLHLSGGRYFFGGWDPDPGRLRARLWRPREQYNATLSYQFRPSDAFRLRLQVPLLQETFYNFKEPTITPYRVYALDEYYYTWRWLPQAHLSWKLGPRWRWEQQVGWLGWRRIRNVVYKDLVTLQETLVPLAGQQDSIQETHIWARGFLMRQLARGEVQWGHELTHQLVEGLRIRNGRATMGDYASWLSLRYQLTDRLTVSPALRWAYNTRFTSPLLASFHFRYELGSGWIWRGGYSRGFRAPSLREMYLYLVFTNHNIQGNPNLQPEKSHHFHTALTWNRLTTRGMLWRFSTSAFYNNLTNLIQLVVLDPVTLYTTYFNLSTFQTLGFQPQLEWKYKHYALQAGANFTRYPGDQWAWEAALNGTFLRGAYTAAFFFKYNGRLPIFVAQEDGTVAFRWIGVFPWLDVTLSRTLWKNLIHVQLGVRNVFDIRQVQANLAGGVHTGGSAAPIGMGRYVFVRLTIGLQKGQL